MKRTPNAKTPVTAPELRRRAEDGLAKQRENQRAKDGKTKSATDTRRLLHELQVHQVELEMQNTELEETRERLETLLEKYTDLYDFAPVGYFSLNEQGRILEVNLTGAALLGVERSRLINRHLQRFVVPASQSNFLAFLKQILTGTGKQACEVAVRREDDTRFWASFHGTSSAPRNRCRVAVSDITSLKKAEEARLRIEALAVANRKLRREIFRRQAVEEALKKSEQHSRRLLEQSRRTQQRLRLLSRQLLSAQEEERMRISRELHDVVAQNLTGINVLLSNLKADATIDTRIDTRNLERNIARTQRLVERSVNIVHEFARELRPRVLDDLGLIPALHAFMKSVREKTGIHVSLSAFAAVEGVNGEKRTVLYRVAQEALTNVVRHARASRVEVKIQKTDGAICMRIRDNGKGFQEERLLRGKMSKRLGLLGMRERLDMVGGNLTITSTPGKGTTIVAQIPLIDARAGRGPDDNTG